MGELYLEDIVQRLYMVSDEWHTFFDRGANEFIDISEQDMRIADYYGEEADLKDYPEWERKDIEKAVQIEREWTEGNYVSFPTPFDIHEYSIMEDFVASIKDKGTRSRLEQAISGKGAFRRFKDLIRRTDLTEAWYAFQEKAYYQIAENWCAENHILYVRREKES